MIDINIKIDKSRAYLEDIPDEIISGSRGIVSVNFIFSDEWEGYTKTAILYVDKYDESTASKVILNDNKIDSKYLSGLITSKCDLYIGVFGDKDECRITTNIVGVHIKEGVPTEGVEADVDVSLYNQIMQIMTTTQQIAQSVREDADAGKFDGEQGPQGEKGDSPTITVEQTISETILTIKDINGTQTVNIPKGDLLSDDFLKDIIGIPQTENEVN